MPTDRPDLILVNPGERELVYQNLGDSLTAVEPPMWLRLIAGYARDRGARVAAIDAEAESLPSAEIAARVERADPLLVVLVVFGHQPSASTQRMVGARLAAEAIKERNPGRRILIVGGHASALPQRTLVEEPIDFVCGGEGPVTVVELLAQLRSAEPDFAKVQGLVWRDLSGQVRENLGAPLIKDLDADLHGDTWDLLPMDRYRAHNWQCFGDLSKRQPYASIYTSLGCPYKCSFCCINAPFGTNRYRMRGAKAVADEIEKLARVHGVRTFKIVDEMFVLNDRHVSAICDEIAARGVPDLNIWAYARVDTVRAGMLPKLRAAGVRWLALGIESGSAHVRDGADKSFDHGDIVRIVREIQLAGINVIGNYIFGLPDDTLESMRATLDLAKELNCEFANFYSAMAYPGSPLYRTALERGWKLPEQWSGYSQHSFDCTPLPTDTLGAADVLRFRDAAFQEYFVNPRYLDSVAQKFGWDTRRHVEQMASARLRRKILESSASEVA